MSTKWDHKYYKNHIQDSSRPELHHTGTVQAFVSMGPCKVTFVYIIWKIVNNILVYGYFVLECLFNISDVEITTPLLGVKNTCK